MHRIPARPEDTDAEAHEVQMELLRGFSPAKRAQLAVSLTDTIVSAARRALMRSHPGATKEELDVLFVELHYGKELADGLRERLSGVQPLRR
jgi:hypothetical protein